MKQSGQKFKLCVRLIACIITIYGKGFGKTTSRDRGSGGAIYLPYLVLHHTVQSTQKGMSTFYGLVS